MSEETVSVVVPFKNGERLIAALFRSLSVQDYTGPWEVVAVNNNSTDRSRDVVADFAKALDLRLVNALELSNPSYARNVGAKAAVGGRLLFIDSDDEVEPGYVRALARALEEYDFVTSRVDSTSLNPPWVQGAHGPPWQEHGVNVLLDFMEASGVNIGVRRALFETLGGFSTEFSGSEDVAFAWTAQLRGGVRLQFVPEAVYRYRYRDSYRGLFRQSANWGRDQVLLYRRFRDLGMPRRALSAAAREWATVMAGLALSGSAQRPELVVRLANCVGRAAGSLRYRIPYF